jgi:hypothetical protein
MALHSILWVRTVMNLCHHDPVLTPTKCKSVKELLMKRNSW